MLTLIFFILSGVTAQQAATRCVNEIEPKLRMNRDAYLAGPATPERQRAALESFDKHWDWLISTEACGSPWLEETGRICIAERSRSGQWSWEGYYRDPIVKRELQPTPKSVVSTAKPLQH